MASCEYYIELLSAGLDGQLNEEQERELADHLVSCPACRELGVQLAAAHAAFAGMEELEAPEGFARGVMDRIRREEGHRPKVVPLFRKAQIRALAGLAACAVLCVGLYGMNGSTKGSGAAAPTAMAAAEAPSAPAAAPAAAADEEIERYVTQRDSNAAAGAGEAAAEKPAQTAAPTHYSCINDRYIRVTWGSTPEAPSARILGGRESLTEFLADFPMDDLSALAEEYGEDWFDGRGLLAVVLEESSGSVTHRIAFQGLRRDEVLILRNAPEAGTADMAAWLILAEVESPFRDGDTLMVTLDNEI